MDTQTSVVCSRRMLAIRDTMDILGGKWKIPIVGVLSHGKMRFTELKNEIEGITPKMLSKELKDLELNDLVKRTVVDTRPVTVEYELTEYGHTLKDLIQQIYLWGVSHRQRMFPS